MIVDLAPHAGLPVALDEDTGELHMGTGVVTEPPRERRLDELRPVLREPDADGPPAPYRMYRDVRRADDEPLLAAAGLRYDLTVTLPGTIGAEYVKTAGHYHPPGRDGVPFPEVYEVVHGHAAFVLQHVDDVRDDAGCVTAVWVQHCEAGERILIPPDCGHVTVNVGRVPLVVADLVSLRCGHLYGSYAARRGAAVHMLVGAPGPRLERNPAYAHVPEPIIGTGSRSAPVVAPEPPLYAQFRAEPGKFSFLDRPAASARALRALWL